MFHSVERSGTVRAWQVPNCVAVRHNTVMANSGYLSVTTTATALNTDTNELPGSIGNTIIIKVPAGGQIVYVGGSDVTADTTAGTGGFPIASGDSLTITAGPGETLYGRVAATTQNVNVLRVGV